MNQAHQHTSTPASSTKKLRRFGLTVGIAFAVLGGIVLWRGGAAAPYLLGAGGILVVAGLLFPRVLAPVEWAWMKLALVLSYVMTRVILTLAFYLAITPTGFILRLLGKDLLSMKIDRSAQSYWVPVDPNGSQNRPDKPY
ncbi:MAG TPA: SxtJ family membrane protein [Rhodothermales bacterium]